MGTNEILEIMNPETPNATIVMKRDDLLAFAGILLGGRATTEVTAQANSKWLTVDDVCETFRLPKSLVKSSKWREENGFPTHRSGGKGYSKPLFDPSEVSEWLSSR